MANCASKKRRHSDYARPNIDVVPKKSKHNRSESVAPIGELAAKHVKNATPLSSDGREQYNRQSQGSTIALAEPDSEHSTISQEDDTIDEEAVPNATASGNAASNALTQRMLTSNASHSVPESPSSSSRRQKPIAAKQPRSAPSAPRPESPGPIEIIMLECRTSDKAAYFVNLPGENITKHTDMWINGELTDHVWGGTSFLVGDVVRLSFGSTPGGYGKIVETRFLKEQKRSVYIVVQWLYRRSDAIGVGMKAVSQDLWRNRWYMLSNHFQVVTHENITSSWREHPLLQTDHYFDACTSKTLRPSAELQQKLDAQLEVAVPRPYRGHIEEE